MPGVLCQGKNLVLVQIPTRILRHFIPQNDKAPALACPSPHNSLFNSHFELETLNFELDNFELVLPFLLPEACCLVTCISSHVSLPCSTPLSLTPVTLFAIVL